MPEARGGDFNYYLELTRFADCVPAQPQIPYRTLKNVWRANNEPPQKKKAASRTYPASGLSYCSILL
jgi:hypothetical protein